MEKIHGGIRYHSRAKMHDFKNPNDPSLDYWNNFSLEDLSHYWDFPNKFETNLCYIQEINLQDIGLAQYPDIYPMKTDIHSFLKENAKEASLQNFPYNGTLKNIAAGFTLINAVLVGLLI